MAITTTDPQGRPVAAELPLAMIEQALLDRFAGNPSITTGADGKATISLTVPDRATAWKLSARGITTETLAGEAEATLVAKEKLFGELKLPLAFVDGDQSEMFRELSNLMRRKAATK